LEIKDQGMIIEPEYLEESGVACRKRNLLNETITKEDGKKNFSHSSQ